MARAPGAAKANSMTEEPEVIKWTTKDVIRPGFMGRIGITTGSRAGGLKRSKLIFCGVGKRRYTYTVSNEYDGDEKKKEYRAKQRGA